MKNKLAWFFLFALISFRFTYPNLSLVFVTDSSSDRPFMKSTKTNYNFTNSSRGNAAQEVDSLLIIFPKEHELFKVVGISPDIKYEMFNKNNDHWENQDNSELNDHY